MKTKHSLVSYLGNREIGNSLWSKKQSTWQHDAASVVAEEKATSPTKNMACELSGRSRSTFLITFSPNGQFIGSTHGDHAVRVTDVTSGKCLHVLKGHPRTPWSIAFHPISNNLLASGCLAGHVRIWDLHGGGSEVWKTPKNTVVTSLTFHPAGQVLLIATSNNILFWDWSQPQPFAQCATRNIYEKVRWVQFDTQGHFLYTGISNTTSVQGEETEETSTTECDPSVRRGDANQLRDRYQMIVEQITSMQRDGVLSGTVSDRHVMPRRQSDSQTNPRDDSQVEEPAATTTSDEVESDGDVEFHQSPDHSQSLEDATNYASLVTLATRAAMITRLGTSAGAPSMTRQSASASHGAADDVTSDTRLSWAPAEGVWSTLGAMSTSPPVQDPRSVSPRQRSVVWSEDARQSDSGEQCGGAGSGGARCSTSVPSAPLQCSDTGVSSSNAARVVASTNSPQTDFPQCTVQSRPAIGRNTHDVTSESTHTRRVSRMVLPPVLGNCAPSTTVESHFSPVHMSSSNTHSSDDTSAASVSDTSSENPQRESRQSVGLSSAQAISLGFNPHEGSTSTEQMPPSTSGESASMRTRPRLVVRVPRTNASTAAAADGGRSSSSITTQSRSEHATTWRSLQERVSEDVEQDGATTEWSRRLHPVDVPATQQSRTADASSENQHRCTVLGESQRSVAFSSVQARTVGSNPQEGSTSTEQTPPSTSGESASMRTRPRLIVRVPRTIASTAAADGGRSSSSINSQLISESTVLQQRATTWWSRQERVSEEDGAGWPGLHRIDLSANQQSDAGEAAGANWSVHRRWSGALQQRVWTMRRELARRRQERRETHRRWHVAPRHHLHPHYSVSILDGSNRSNNGLQAAINRAIAGAFTARGEASVASNIDNLTHRIQRWDISSRFQMPDIDDSDINLVVSHCKMHNDTSCDISKDSTLLTTFVPSHQGFPDDTILGVFSLCPETLGQCMFTKSFGPNAISVSLSPLNNYVLVGLAARRLAWVFAQQMVGQVYRLKTAVAGEDSMQTSCDFQHVCDLMHPCDTDMQSHVSVNTACWMPDVGQGIAYATNKGDLHICTPGYDEGSEKTGGGGSSHEFNSVRQNLMQMLGLTVPRRMHYSALRHQRQTTGSQTDPSSDHSD